MKKQIELDVMIFVLKIYHLEKMENVFLAALQKIHS